jgi:hypothetical protein
LGDLQEILAGLQLPIGREPARIQVVEQVEAGQLVQSHAVVDHGIGLTAEHLHRVTEVH